MHPEAPTILGVIAVQNHGGSGTLLLQSLLDHHPEILSLPALYGIELVRFWEETPVTTMEAFVEEFVKRPYHAYWFDPDPIRYRSLYMHGLHTMGDNRDEHLGISVDIFKEYFLYELQQKPFSLQHYITAVYLAYAKAKNKVFNQQCWILFPFHSNPPKQAERLAEAFSRVKFIHMLREPIQCLASGIRFETSQENGFNNPYWHKWLIHPHQSASPLIEAANTMTCGIKLEDLHTRSEATMRSLAKWLEIAWQPSLLESTYDNKKWWNRPDSKPVNGFNKQFATFSGHDIIPTFDRWRLEFLFNNWKKAWHYPQPTSIDHPFIKKIMLLLLLLPFKMDLLPQKIYTTKKINFFKVWFIDCYRHHYHTVYASQPFLKRFASSTATSLTYASKLFINPFKYYVKRLRCIYRILKQRGQDYNLVKLLPIEE